MAAALQNYPADILEPGLMFPMMHRLSAVAGAIYYFGVAIAVDSQGRGAKMTGAPGLKPIGMYVGEKFTAVAASTIEVRSGMFERKVSGTDPVTVADDGNIVYAEDDLTIAKTSAGGALSALGRLYWRSGKAFVQIGALAAAPDLSILAPVRVVRGVVAANVADLTAFTVASNDGLTYTAGQRVLLAAQTTAAQCGIYVVGTVATGVAPLTRAADMPAGALVVPGGIIEVSEGTVFAGSTWKAFATVGAVVGTNDPVYYPRKFSKVVQLASGTYTIGAGGGSEPLFLRSTTLSDVQATRDTANGTITTTIMYVAPVASRIAGKAGVAAVEVRSAVAAGTILNTDTSYINVLITNW